MLDTDRRVSPVRPLLAGDFVAGIRVIGFGWQQSDGLSSTHLDDRLLLEGDEQLPAPPQRPVPQTADAADATGVMPPEDMAWVRDAASIHPGIPALANAVLDRPNAPWQRLARSLLGAVHATGHRAWLAGGAVRDIVSRVPAEQVKDLDMAGTVPTGRFTDITYQTLRALGLAEYRTTVTPKSLVCAVTPTGSRTRLIEYRGLTQGGLRFPAVGSQIAEDARYRDFTFNALLYDVLDHLVIDGCGTGVDDLLAEHRRFVPRNHTQEPFARAMIVLRAAKFAVRWSDGPKPDLTALVDWIADFPTDFCRSLSAPDWNRLTGAYRTSVRGPQQQLREFAAQLPPAGRELLETLIGPAA
jgi:poly(A) polymerase